MGVRREADETAREDGESTPLMPDLTRPRYGFSHTVDSALTSLSRMGVAAGRITLKAEGPGWQSSRVVGQDPPPGTALTADKDVKLKVAGEGLFYYLPTGMRDEAREIELGAQELTALFDDPVEKAAYFVRQGGLYFDLRPENSLGCARWIRLFGIAPEDWPREKWGHLAALLPWLHVLAGTETGVRLALKMLLGLEVRRISWRPRVTRLSAEQLSGLGASASHLGVDLLVGDGLEDEAAMALTLGPVSLDEYESQRDGDGEARLARVLRLVVPCHLEWSVDWLVGDESKSPRLGEAGENSVLGVNSYLGSEAEVRV